MTFPKASSIFALYDGENYVDLFRATDSIAMAPGREGIGDFSFSPSQYDEDLASLDSLTFKETVTLNHRSGRADSMVYAERRLIAMLRKAWQYHYRPRHNAPVVLIAKAPGETNPRYAVVRQCPAISGRNRITSEAFRQAVAADGDGVTIERFIWRDFMPGTMPSPIVLGQVGGGPTAPTESVIANYRDNHAITDVYVADGGVFGPNLYGEPGLLNLFPAAPAVGDIIYFGGDDPFFNISLWLVTAAVYVGVTFVWEFSNGAAGWPDLVLGDTLTLYPDDDIWARTGLAAINVWPGSTWAKEVVNGQNKLWIRCRIDAIATSFTSPPQNNLYPIYNQRNPYVSIPANTLEGDAPPYLLLRAKSPEGGDADETFANVSKILVGSKSQGLDGFLSHINLGNDGNPAGVTVTYGTDTAAAASPEAPGGDHAHITFATDITMVMRARVVLQDLAADFVGEYRPFLRIDGSGTFDGKVQIVVRLDSTSDFASKNVGPEIDTVGDESFEVVDLWPLDRIRIPFGKFMSADDLAGADLIFEIWASRDAGAGELDLKDLILIPIDEWSVEYVDPVTDIEFGSSALRGLRLLDDDGGVITDRTMLRVLSAWNGTPWPAETWSRHGLAPRLDPKAEHRLYFLIEHYNATGEWAGPPLSAQPPCQLAVSLYQHAVYFNLRGDE